MGAAGEGEEKEVLKRGGPLSVQIAVSKAMSRPSRVCGVGWWWLPMTFRPGALSLYRARESAPCATFVNHLRHTAALPLPREPPKARGAARACSGFSFVSKSDTKWTYSLWSQSPVWRDGGSGREGRRDARQATIGSRQGGRGDAGAWGQRHDTATRPPHARGRTTSPQPLPPSLPRKRDGGREGGALRL